MNWEIGIDICALPHVKQTASGNLRYSTGDSALYSVFSVFSPLLDEWGGEWGGREVQEGGDICAHIADSLVQHYKAAIF